MPVTRDHYVPDQLDIRRVDGVPVYSHAVSVSGGTRTIHIAGQLGRDANGNVVGRGDKRRQFEQTHENLKIALAAAGATMADVVQTVTYTTDIEALFACVDVRLAWYGDRLPTSTTVEVRRLAHPDLMVEVSAIAVV
ncbi:MAG: RidA family protein [Alphaproteobacteria bacterium]|jgi:2-iminobutanoate/2-iminopropanoate deaminase